MQQLVSLSPGSSEIFLVELPIKVQTKEIIAERDLRRHLELLRKIVRRDEVVACHRVIQQCPQRASSVRSHLAESLESIMRLRAFSGSRE